MDPEQQLAQLLEQYPDMDPVQAVNIVLGKEAAPMKSQLDDFISGMINNVASVPKGIYSAITSPIDTAKAMGGRIAERGSKLMNSTPIPGVLLRSLGGLTHTTFPSPSISFDPSASANCR